MEDDSTIQEQKRFSQFRESLGLLFQDERSAPFREPVDPIALGIPDYLKIIKHPMDLGTIQFKLDSNVYTSVDEALADVELIWSNAFTYNSENSPVHQYAMEMKRFFEESFQVGMEEDESQKYAQMTINEKVGAICDELEDVTDHHGRLIIELFLALPSRAEYPSYYNIITHPISIEQIRKKNYLRASDVKRDFELLFANAQQFNLPDSLIYHDSGTLLGTFHKLFPKYFSDSGEKGDDDFMEQEVTPRKRRDASDILPYVDDPDEFRETRVSKRRKSTSKASSTYDEDDEDELEDAQDYVYYTDKAPKDVPEYVIEKIMGVRALSDDPELKYDPANYEYYIKWKGKAYVHTQWLPYSHFDNDSVNRPKITRYWQQRKQKEKQGLPFVEDKPDEGYFNTDYLEVERIIGMKEEKADPPRFLFLVKWKSLPYDCSTWEPRDIINDDQKIDQFRRFNVPPPPDYKMVPIKKFTKIEAWPYFKDGHSLRQYQIEGMNWLAFCYADKRGCILADEMGLGKTIQSISLLHWIYKTENNRGPFLVVAPLSTIGHWARELDEWTDMNAVNYQGNNLNREFIRDHEFYFQDAQGNVIAKQFYRFNVLLTTYEMIMGDDWTALSNIKWQCIVIDEAQRLKNQDSKLLIKLKQFRTSHKVLLTGTPLQNNTQELWSLLNFIDDKKFGSSKEFLSQFGTLESSEQVNKLHAVLRPHLLRRMKDDVEKSIPPKEETLVEVELTSLQKQYYRAIFEGNRDFLNKGCVSKNVPNLMNVFMQLRKVCNHPFLIEGVEDKAAKNAQHDADFYNELIQSSGKMVLLDKLLPKLKEGGHKVLIFSQMMRVLDLLENYLRFRNYLYERLDGSIRGNERQASIDRFCKPGSDRFVFLLCTRAGGVGINLTSADTVVIFDSDWNPQNDIQAQARCHRIGQKSEVKVYRLITAKTYERTMFERSSKKLGLDHVVLSDMGTPTGTATQKTSLDKKEIDELLRHGAYDLYTEDDSAADAFSREDIDQILNRSHKVVWNESSAKVMGGNSSFAKASFYSSKADKEIDIDDPNFWDKILPEAKTPEKLLEQLLRGDFSSDLDKQNQFVRDLGDIVNEVADAFRSGKPDTVSHSRSVLLRIFEVFRDRYIHKFEEEHQEIVLSWIEEITRPKRNRKTVTRPPTDVLSPRKNKKPLRSLPERPWSDRERKAFHSAFMALGPHRWSDVRTRAGLLDRDESELVEYGQEFVKQCIVNADESDRSVLLEVLDLIISAETEEIEVDPRPDFQKLIKRKLKNWVRQLRCLLDLHEVVGDDPDWTSLDIPTLGKPLTTWWTDRHDRSLVIGLHKYGFGNYDDMREDPDLAFVNHKEEMAAAETPKTEESESDKGEDNADKMQVEQPIKEESKEDVDPEDEDKAEKGEPKLKITFKMPTLTAAWPSSRTLDSHVRLVVEALKKKVGPRDKSRSRYAEPPKKKKPMDRQRDWTKREINDFRMALLAFGEGNWDRLASHAELHKSGLQVEDQFERLVEECKRLVELSPAKTEEDQDDRKNGDSYIPEGLITISMAKKLLKRLKLMREVKAALAHPQFEARLPLADTADMPQWWFPPIHDKALLENVVDLGLGTKEWDAYLENEEISFYQESDGTPAFKPHKLKFLQNFCRERPPLISRLEYLTLVITDPNSSEVLDRRIFVENSVNTRSSRSRDNGDSVEPLQQLENAPRIKLNLNMKTSTRDIVRDEEGRATFPIQAKGSTIHALGKVVHDRPAFHSKSYIWPVGFKSSRRLPSIKNNKEYVVYTSEILDGGSGPLFQVTPSDQPSLVLQHNTSSGVWCELLKMIKKKASVSVSGPEMFGFSDNTVRMLIQELPNAQKCTSYQWKNFGKAGGAPVDKEEAEDAE